MEAFRYGARYSGTSQDKATEPLIHYHTPESDEDTRIIQRNAVKWIFETDDKKAEQHMDTIQDTIKKMFDDDK